jgi:TRAP-type C4-dicarboxylate transport system permease large subunit
MLDCPMDEYTREALPFLAAVILLIVLMVFLPGIVLFLPNLMF